MKHEHLDETPERRESPSDRAIDDALTQVLRAEDPGAAFTQRVLARAREERAAQQSGRPLHAIGTGAAASASSAETAAAWALRAESALLAASASASSEVSAESLRSPATLGSTERMSGGAADELPRADTHRPRVRATRFTATRKLIAAIAASLTLLAAGAQQWVQHRRYVAEGERARAQVLAALRLTNEKLDIVHDKITERDHAR